MSSGSFLLSTLPLGSPHFGKLQKFDYDDCSRFKRHKREAVLMMVRMACDGWRRNYYRFRDASFRIEEMGDYNKPILIYGQPYSKKHPPMPVRYFN